MRAALLLLAIATGAFAQEAEIQRAIMELDQRTVDFAARLNGMPAADLQRLENAFARQRLEVMTQEIAPALRPYQRQAAAREAEGYVLQLPPPVIRAKAVEDLRQLIEPKRCEPVRPPGDDGAVCR
jgi:hypothetical protein